MATSNLLIVGDSFVAEGEEQEWTWWNKLAKDLNAKSLNLGIIGASNFNIWHQLKEGLKIKPDYVLISLTAPNRIESVEDDFQDVDYYAFLRGQIRSWSAHDRLAQKEISVDYVNKFCDYNIAVSKDAIIVDSMLQMLKGKKSVILTNLFTEYKSNSSKVSYSVIPRNYCDVESGVLDEPEAGHIYKSWHDKLYTNHKEELLGYMNANF